MPVEATAAAVMVAGIAGMVVGMLSEGMLQAILRLDTLLSALAVDVITILRGPRTETGAMQRTHIIGTAAVAGEAITGEEVTGIPHTDILEWAITAWAMAIRTTGVAIMVTATRIIHITETGDTIRTCTDSGRR
jgi:hypothetical protein